MASVSQVILANVTQTTAAGVVVNGSRPFNDLVEFGKFPLEQDIVRINKVEVWADDRVFGIRVSYLLKDGSTASQLRGRDSGTLKSFDLANNQIITGVFGRRDDQGNIGSLSFVVFEINNGRVTPHGPFGSPPNAAKPFGTFGTIIAFAGTDENRFGLCSLSVFKDNAAGIFL